MTGGKSRPSAAAASASADVMASTWSRSATLSAVTETPARWRSRTIAAGSAGSVPWNRPTITPPASCSGVQPLTSSCASSTSPIVGPQEVGGVRVLRLGPRPRARGRATRTGSDGLADDVAGEASPAGARTEARAPADQQDAGRDHGQTGSDRGHGRDVTGRTPATKKRQARAARTA